MQSDLSYTALAIPASTLLNFKLTHYRGLTCSPAARIPASSLLLILLPRAALKSGPFFFSSGLERPDTIAPGAGLAGGKSHHDGVGLVGRLGPVRRFVD